MDYKYKKALNLSAHFVNMAKNRPSMSQNIKTGLKLGLKGGLALGAVGALGSLVYYNRRAKNAREKGQKARLRKPFMTTNEGRWITVRGRRIFIKNKAPSKTIPFNS